MKWEALVNRAKKNKIDVSPLQHPWWQKYHARLTVQRNRADEYRSSRHGGLFLSKELKTKFSTAVGRTRVEGGSVGIFFEDAKSVSRVIDHVVNHQPDYQITELCCPISDEHVNVTSAQFPTVVRETLFQNKFRYRIVGHVGYGYRQDSTRLDEVMDEWQRWSDESLGQISKGARYRWAARDTTRLHPGVKAEYRWSGIMSFYTNDQQLSFLMAMSFPEFYTKTEKVVLIDELGKESSDGKEKEGTI